MSTGGLEKMVIEAYSKSDDSASSVKTFTVMFNPASYTQSRKVVYEARQGKGDAGSPLSYKRIAPQERSFELLFDGTGVLASAGVEGKKSTKEKEKGIVQTRVDEFLAITSEHQGEIHRPYYLKLVWGTLIARCVLTSAEVTYDLFRPDGTPLRARIRAAFTDYVTDERRVAKQRNASPDLSHVHVVQAGEHLCQLAHHYYGDAGRYLQVARWNGLRSFRLEVGQRLEFPPIREEIR